MTNRLQSLVGLARRAGAVRVGGPAIARALGERIGARRDMLLVVACDAGRGARRQAARAAAAGVPAVIAPLSREELGRAIGLGSAAAVLVVDGELARACGRVLGNPGVSGHGKDSHLRAGQRTGGFEQRDG